MNKQHSELLNAWLDGQLSKDQQKEFADLCSTNEEFAGMVEQANYINMLVDTSEDLEPPAWNKEASFSFLEKRRWWQWQGLPASALVCSVLAIFMVLTGFNVSVDNGRFSAGFGQGVSKEDIDQIVFSKLAEFEQQTQANNQQMLSQYIDSLQQQQLQTSSQLTEYLLSSSRQERREDFAELIKFVNQQRFDDQVFYARQLNELQQEINAQTGLDVDAVRPISDLSINE